MIKAARVLVVAALVAACVGLGAGTNADAAPNGWPHSVVAGFSTPTGNGFWLVYADGTVSATGDARSFGDAAGIALNRPIVGGAVTPNGRGYWLVAGDGGIFTFGDARFFGSMGATHLNQPIFSMAPARSGRGYWLVARDGGIFAFGDARFYGSTGGRHLNEPIVGIMAGAAGAGYDLLARDGGIFTFGNAPYYGSLPARRHLVSDVVGIAPTPTHKGYWVVRSNGTTAGFGDAKDFGHPPYVATPGDPVTAVFANPVKQGYRLVTQSGKTVAFGTAPGPRRAPSRVLAVAAGGAFDDRPNRAANGFSCALLANRTVKCWGDNSYGQLGNGTTTNSSTPVTVAGLHNAKAVALGAQHACALLTNGTVKCWGFNFAGRLGNGTNIGPLWCYGRYFCSGQPVAVKRLRGATAIASGSENSCALLADTTVKCWGANFDGAVGNGSFRKAWAAKPVRGLRGVSAIAVGGTNLYIVGGVSCAVLKVGTVKCWGFNGTLIDNPHGKLCGTESILYRNYKCSPTPITIKGLSGAKAVAIGHTHACALLTAGTVKCWGTNPWGQLGDPQVPLTQSTTPVVANGLVNARAIVSGPAHTCASIAGGSVKCWGLNLRGQLGRPITGPEVCRHQLTYASYHCSRTPVIVPGVSDATKIAAAQQHTCALVTPRKVECWGNNERGELGDGSTTSSSRPVAVIGL